MWPSVSPVFRRWLDDRNCEVYMSEKNSFDMSVPIPYRWVMYYFVAPDPRTRWRKDDPEWMKMNVTYLGGIAGAFRFRFISD